MIIEEREKAMAKFTYPAIFEKDKAEGGYVVTFPDWDGATQGETITDAMEMATDYLGLVCWDEGRRTPPEWIQKLIIKKIESVV